MGVNQTVIIKTKSIVLFTLTERKHHAELSYYYYYIILKAILRNLYQDIGDLCPSELIDQCSVHYPLSD